jgi:hypothetical protein
MGATNYSLSGNNASLFANYSFANTNASSFAIKNITRVLDGLIEFTISYNDSANNTGVTSVSLYEDNTAPSSIVGNTTGAKVKNSSQIVQVTVIDGLMTNSTITLYYYRYGYDTSWQSTMMTANSIGTNTVYNTTINTNVSMNVTVDYYVTGSDNATNPFSSNNGSATSPLATFSIGSTGTIDGYVIRNGTTTAIVGATVSDGTRAAVSNSAGFYQISSVPPGTYTLTVSATNYITNSSAASVTVSAGTTTTTNVTIANNATGTLDGYVYLTNTSNVIPNSSVQVSDGTRTVSTNKATGYYYISSVPAGTYTLTVSGSGYRTNSTTGVVLSTGGTTSTNLKMTGAENFNVTIPGSVVSGHTNGFWDSGWYDFFLSTTVFSAATTNYTFASLFNSINSNYSIIYRYNATSASWSSYVPSAAGNTLTSVASSDDHYWINVNGTDRVEIESRY